MTSMEKYNTGSSLYSAAEMEDEIINHLSEISNILPQGITRECSLFNDLSLDSLDKVELTMWCEKTFDVVITPDEESSILTVGDVLNTMRGKKEWRQDC